MNIETLLTLLNGAIHAKEHVMQLMRNYCNVKVNIRNLVMTYLNGAGCAKVYVVQLPTQRK